MNRTKIKQLLSAQTTLGRVCIKGWVRTRRDAKSFSFMEVNDGSSLENIQVLADAGIKGYEQVKKLTTGSSISVSGEMTPSPGREQAWEIHATDIEVLSQAPESYPLQKKRHTDEFLRTISHLRPRTNKYSAAFRMRSEISFAIHQFFHDRGFIYVHTPIITGSDCEGAGQLFQVTALDMANPPITNGQVDYSHDFFGKPANLTVSGQLEAELLALALGDVYTFSPTFRAENSNTSRHMAEFWMVEPEMAFCDLAGNMDNAEALIKSVTARIMEICPSDLGLFAKYVDKTLLTTLENIASAEFIRIPYKAVIPILSDNQRRFEYEIHFGADLQTEHERFLAETHFKQPLIIYDYPKSIKPFYMRVNDDEQTVAAMDVIVPRIGEIIGGSQREERLDILERRMDETGIRQSDYWWYLDSRRYGSVVHSGYGLGFERLLMLLTGISNIRDVIPFPRTPGNLTF